MIVFDVTFSIHVSVTVLVLSVKLVSCCLCCAGSVGVVDLQVSPKRRHSRQDLLPAGAH